MPRPVKAVVSGFFLGAMLAMGVGPAVTALAPETAAWMEDVICMDGHRIEHDSETYAYAGGESGVEHTFYCVPEPGSGLAPAPIPKNAFVVMLWMSLLWLAILWPIFTLFALRPRRRRRERRPRA